MDCLKSATAAVREAARVYYRDGQLGDFHEKMAKAALESAGLLFGEPAEDEKGALEQALRLNRDNYTAAAKSLGMAYPSFVKSLKAHGLHFEQIERRSKGD